MSPFLYTMYEYFNNYIITKCLLFCDVLLMLIGSRQYTVLFPLKYWIELNWNLEFPNNLIINKTKSTGDLS